MSGVARAGDVHVGEGDANEGGEKGAVNEANRGEKVYTLFGAKVNIPGTSEDKLDKLDREKGLPRGRLRS